MKLSRREKVTVLVGACVVAATLLIAAIVSPLARKWYQLGSRLGPELKTVRHLTERAQKRDNLLARRTQLVGELGLLVGEESSSKTGPSTRPRPQSPRPDRNTGPEGLRTATASSVLPPPGADPEPPANPAANNPAVAAMTSATGSPKSPDAPPGKEPEAKDAGNSSDYLSFATHIERTAKSANVKIKRFQPKKQPISAKKAKYYEPVALQITFDCNLQSMLKLLHGLEKGSRLARVEHLDLRRDLKKGGNVEVTLDLIGYEPKAR